MSRRQFLSQFGYGLGSMAFAHLLQPNSFANTSFSGDTGLGPDQDTGGGILKTLHHQAKAKRVIFLFQSGAPSQLELLDYKPKLNQQEGQQLPDSVRGEQRLTGMSGNQSSLPLVGSAFKFQQHGQSGAWLSDLLPQTAKFADDLCIVRSMYTEAINHGPGVTFMQTGSQLPGRPSMGGWLDYGLGRSNENLPAYVVMVTKNKGGQPLASRLWGSGFLPSKYEGVQFRSSKDPVLYLNNPAGIDNDNRRSMLDALKELHQLEIQSTGNQEIENKIAQHELAFRMQSSIPDVVDFSDEPQSVLDSYGPQVTNPGSFAANCLLARRLAQRDVKFIQLFHQGWDHHGGLPGGIKAQCDETDQPCAALLGDLKQKGLLEDTLVVWAGEFGRTNYCQGKLSPGNYGRDHHPRCFSIWMAGGGIKPGTTYGATDDYGYNVIDNPVHIHDLHATMMHLLGIDHLRLTFKYQGRHFRLTDVHGKIIHEILA